MIARFSWSHPAIVASHAGSGLHTHMVKASTEETDRIGVTGFARSVANDMVGRLESRNDTSASRVTSCTVGWSTFEYATNMAGFTLNIDMNAGKGKTGFHMIEVTGFMHSLCINNVGQ